MDKRMTEHPTSGCHIYMTPTSNDQFKVIIDILTDIDWSIDFASRLYGGLRLAFINRYRFIDYAYIYSETINRSSKPVINFSRADRQTNRRSTICLLDLTLIGIGI